MREDDGGFRRERIERSVCGAEASGGFEAGGDVRLEIQGREAPGSLEVPGAWAPDGPLSPSEPLSITREEEEEPGTPVANTAASAASRQGLWGTP